MEQRGAYGVLREGDADDDPGASSPEAFATPSAARGAVLSRMLGKHVGDVLNYLALLAWNRCVMSLVGGPTRTTIDVLMTRQFHGLKLVWTWAYTLGVSSACTAVVRWSAEKLASLEEEERGVLDDGVEAADEPSASGSLARFRRSPLSPLRLTRRFRAFAHGRLQGACAYAAMWAWAVASLGTLPARTAEQDVFATALLSVVFAVVAVFGAKGEGPLGGALRVTTERDLASNGEGVAAEDAARLSRRNEASRVTRASLRATCEWIVAVAWVGAFRRFAGTVFGVESFDANANVKTQLVGWFVAFVAVGARVAFVAARAAGQDEPWCAEFGRDAAEAVEAVKAALVRALPKASRDDAATLTARETPLLVSETPETDPSSESSESSETRRVGDGRDEASRLASRLARRGKGREKILDSVSVARDASSMLAGAFAFTAGVALNAAAQTTWRSVVHRTVGTRGFGAAPSATAYAAALSAATVAAATYAERRGSEDEAVPVDDADAGAKQSSRRHPSRRRLRRRSVVALALAADEARVGAFVAGFAWNAAFAASVGDDGARGWPWIAAAGWTTAAAGYAAARESVGEGKNAR